MEDDQTNLSRGTRFGGHRVVSSVELEQLVGIELGGLEDLDLSDVGVLERVDAMALFFDLLSDGVGDELLPQFLYCNMEACYLKS